MLSLVSIAFHVVANGRSVGTVGVVVAVCVAEADGLLVGEAVGAAVPVGVAPLRTCVGVTVIPAGISSRAVEVLDGAGFVRASTGAPAAGLTGVLWAATKVGAPTTLTTNRPSDEPWRLERER